MLNKPSIIALCLCSFCYLNNIAYGKEILIDTIIATVDDTPITLVEFGSRLTPPRAVSIEQLKSQTNLQKALDALILEKLLLAEAERKNIKVMDDDIARYMDEVKKKNNLTDAEFEKALIQEGQSLKTYQERIKTEILKSRVAAASIKNTTTITDEEVDDFIRARLAGETSKPNSRKAWIKQAVVVKSVYPDAEGADDIKKIAVDLIDDKDAKYVSDLGHVNETDLAPAVAQAIKSLKSGQISEPIDTGEQWFLFQVVERVTNENELSKDDADQLAQVNPEIREQVKFQLEQEKLQKKMEIFIDQELPKLHTVDKRV